MEVNVTQVLVHEGEPIEYEKFLPNEYLKDENNNFKRTPNGGRIQLKDPRPMDLRYVLTECLYRNTKDDSERSVKELMELRTLAKRIQKNDVVQFKSSDVVQILDRIAKTGLGKIILGIVSDMLEPEIDVAT